MGPREASLGIVLLAGGLAGCASAPPKVDAAGDLVAFQGPLALLAPAEAADDPLAAQARDAVQSRLEAAGATFVEAPQARRLVQVGITQAPADLSVGSPLTETSSQEFASVRRRGLDRWRAPGQVYRLVIASLDPETGERVASVWVSLPAKAAAPAALKRMAEAGLPLPRESAVQAPGGSRAALNR
jgi:type IV pilus biogenesis protein CpaD/CtpE